MHTYISIYIQSMPPTGSLTLHPLLLPTTYYVVSWVKRRERGEGWSYMSITSITLIGHYSWGPGLRRGRAEVLGRRVVCVSKITFARTCEGDDGGWWYDGRRSWDRTKQPGTTVDGVPYRPLDGRRHAHLCCRDCLLPGHAPSPTSQLEYDYPFADKQACQGLSVV